MDEERLARYLAGEASDVDRSQVEAWAAADPAHRAQLGRLAAVWANKPTAETWNVDQAWASVAARLDNAVSEPEPIRRRTLHWLAAAAVLAAVGLGSFVALSRRPLAYETGVGERREILLADGSRAVLAPASRLEIASSYGQPTRLVTLVGRAWFEVTHDEARPFRVVSGQTTVEDLGTEFEVDATSNTVVVSVMSGSVAVRSGSAPTVTLGPKDVATVAETGVSAVDHEVEVERFMAWRKGTLSFENRPLRQVLSELERWHEVNFAAKDDVLDRSFTGDLPTDRLDVAMATITTAMTLTANRVGNTISLAHKAAP